MHVSSIFPQSTLHILLGIKQSESVPRSAAIGKPNYQHTILMVLDRRVWPKEIDLRAKIQSSTSH